MKMNGNWLVLVLAAFIVVFAGSASADNLIAVVPGTSTTYGSVSSAGVSLIASGNMLASSATGDVYVADFNGDGYDEMIQITPGSEYYNAPIVDGSSLTGTELASSGLSNSTKFLTGKFLASENRELLYQVGVSGNDGLAGLTSTGAVEWFGWKTNLDPYTLSGDKRFLVGDFDGNGVDDIYVIHGGTDYVIESITYANDSLYATTHVANGLNANPYSFGYASGYFVENDGRDQVLRFANTEADNIYGLNDGSGWGLTELAAASVNLAGNMAGDEVFVVGDFDNDGFDELVVIRSTGMSWYYDNFAIVEGVLTADAWDINSGTTITAFNFAGNFAVIPEPITMVLLGLGGLSMAIRRK